MSKLLIYRASAGSGKTHTLVTHYIEWALRYPDAFKHILAVTFTNAATQEMKQRIIAYLYSLSMGETTPLQQALVATGWTLESLQAESNKVLAMILHNYGDFSVTTIDSFFYKIVQSFSKELGLSQRFSIEMDQSLALEEVVDEMITQLPNKPFLQKGLVDFALHKLLQGQSWEVRKDIQQIGKELFQESFKQYEKALGATFQTTDTFARFFVAIHHLLDAFQHKMSNIGKAALTILAQEKCAPEDFAYGRQGVLGYFLKLASKKAYKPTQRALAAKDNLASWLTKKNKTELLQRVVTTSLHPLLVEAIALYEEEGKRYNTGLAVFRFIYIFGIISELLQGLAQYRANHKVLFISDVSSLLYQIIEQNQTPFLYEQIGNQYHHLLIDEFQDLSLFQWMNIKPLLHNSLAQGYTNLLVGDVKQSIYRWRGSHWKLLNHQVEAAYPMHDLRRLTINRRSQAVIVLFNNHFFNHAAQQLTNHLQANLPSCHEGLSVELEEIEALRKAYKDVVQQLSPEALQASSGEVTCLFFYGQAAALQELITLLEQLKKENIPATAIVLLVRNHRESDLLTTLSRANAGDSDFATPYPLTSAHDCVLSSYGAVNLLIYALQYLHNGGSDLYKIAFIQAYYSCIKKQSIPFHHYTVGGSIPTTDDPVIEKLLPEAFLRQEAFLKSLSLYTGITQLISLFFSNNNEHTAVLGFFESVVLDFLDKGEDTIPAFLHWWEKKGKQLKIPTASQADSIKVMTIHQAKGLEFKRVIMPFCNWNLDHSSHHSPILWSSSGQEPPFNLFNVLPIRYGSDLKETYYAEAYHLEQIQTHLDNLNLLYVAFTRAQEQLYIMALRPKKEGEMATVADLLYGSLSLLQTSCTHLSSNIAVHREEGQAYTKFWFSTPSST
ncbi:MAG: UvrD-helicase domain-containing protein [Amoebophilaceae bacterium]|nr:UvrD-helicase domain-containing protein [Amoebophilaceae bacterium]